jgi:hypothetical protein
MRRKELGILAEALAPYESSQPIKKQIQYGLKPKMNALFYSNLNQYLYLAKAEKAFHAPGDNTDDAANGAAAGIAISVMDTCKVP